jgi:hypothetical protein
MSQQLIYAAQQARTDPDNTSAQSYNDTNQQHITRIQGI